MGDMRKESGMLDTKMITNEAAQEALNALYSILNVEGAAHLGAEAPVMEGLDVPWHFEKVRAAIKTLTSLGFRPD